MAKMVEFFGGPVDGTLFEVPDDAKEWIVLAPPPFLFAGNADVPMTTEIVPVQSLYRENPRRLAPSGARRFDFQEPE